MSFCCSIMVIYFSRYSEKLFYYISLLLSSRKELFGSCKRDVYRRMYLLVSRISLLENLFFGFFSRSQTMSGGVGDEGTHRVPAFLCAGSHFLLNVVGAKESLKHIWKRAKAGEGKKAKMVKGSFGS